MNAKKKSMAVIIGIAVTIVSALIVFLVYANSNTVKVKRQMELARNYLLEEDYEEAIAAFKAVLEVAPKAADAYLELAEVYIAENDLENAVKVLEAGSKETDSEKIVEMLEKHTAELAKREATATTVSQIGSTETTGGLQEEQKLFPNKSVEEENLREEISTAPESETVVQFTAEEAYKAYDVVLNEYREACAVSVQDWFDNRSKYMKQYPKVSFALMDEYHMPSHYDEETGDEPFEIAYSYIDIDHNGIPELLIIKGNHELIINEIFVFDGVKAVPLNVRSDERYDSYGIYTNGVIAVYKENLEYYRQCSDGYTLQQIFLSENELLGLQDYIIDDLTILGKDIEAMDDELAQTDNLIGVWSNQEMKSMAEWAECTLYEDGTVGISEHNSFFCGTYTVEADQSVSIYLNDGYFYDNADASWYEEAVECRINLIAGENKQRMKFSLIYDTYGNHMCESEIVLIKINDTAGDYSSVLPKIQEYHAKVSQSQTD